MNYSSILAFESKLAPGLKFQLRKMSHRRRVEYNLAGAEIFAKLRELDRQRQPHLDEVKRAEDAAKIEPCICTHVERDPKHADQKLPCAFPGCHCREPKPDHDAFEQLISFTREYQALQIDELAPRRIRWAVETLEGFEIDGQPATLESFLEKAPEDLIGELDQEIQRVMGLTFEEQLGFKSPTTSAAPVAGPTSSMNAAPVNGKGCTEPIEPMAAVPV